MAKKLKSLREARYTGKCSICGTEAKFIFEPDPTRDMICNECYSLTKKKRQENCNYSK